ncbi:trypsin-like serine protease [Amycolatopsis sp. OK19-0408]|uniref:Trypsin-like serine protease n=1 Tax=Amycolatopsis iheyensis TaxID=2945988 RepID=A0A9X2NJ00_9PSEU|nr:trypsin-like serine protease [Amycolatopsis iheyensis]MCR6488331.1 trypsin-like serine protease [Amycolatopsis iheyensis]
MRLRTTVASTLALLSVLTGVSTAAAAPPPPTDTVSPQLVGGDPASQAYAGAGSLQLLDHGDPNWHSCGLTFIDQGYDENGNPASVAVTQGHCLTNEPSLPEQARMPAQVKARFVALRSAAGDPDIDRSDPTIYHARFGSTNRLHGGLVRNGTEIDVPPGWRWGYPDADGWIWDIALIRLDGHLDGIRAARIAPAQPRLPARSIGWGTRNVDPTTWTGPAPTDLAQLDIPLLPSTKCADGGIGTGELCGGVPPTGGGACTGDSGSGLLQKHGTTWYLIGTASRGASPYCGVAPTIFNNVSAYEPWITQHAHQLLPGRPKATTHTALPATPAT